MNRELVLVTTRSFSTGKNDFTAELVKNGFEVFVGDFTHELEKLAPQLSKAVAWIAGVAPITAEHLSLAKNLKVISRYGVGYESVDLAAASAQNIIVTNTPAANSNAVAEHALALLFASARNVVSSHQNVLSGNWQVIRGQEIFGSQVGVVGFGQIGKLVVQKLVALGASVFVSDPFIDSEQISQLGAKKIDIDELSKNCDFVILQAPGGQQIVNEKWLQQARAGQVIINTARADLVDEKALVQALKEKRIRFYAADAVGDEQASPILTQAPREKIIVTAHIAAQTDSAIDQMGEMAVKNVLAVLAGEPPLNPVGRAGL